MSSWRVLGNDLRSADDAIRLRELNVLASSWPHEMEEAR